VTLRAAFVGACPYPVPQGSQVYLAESARALQRRGHDVRLIAYGHGEGPAPEDLRVVRTPRVPGDTFTRSGPNFAKLLLDPLLIRTIRREPADVLFAHNFEALLACLLARTAPVIYQAHNAMADELPYYLGGWVRPFGLWLDRMLPKRAAAVVAPHELLGEYLIECGCERDQTHVVPPPIDTSVFHEAHARGDDPAVLYTGNVDAYQNLPLLTRAMRQVRVTHPRVRLVVLTHNRDEFPEAETLRAQSFDDMRDQLAHDYILAVPRVSWSGFPIKEINAMAAGLPIVACESAGGSVRHEVDGLLVPDNDEAAFAAALLRLIEDRALRQRMGQSSRERAATRHHPDAIGEQLETIALAAYHRHA